MTAGRTGGLAGAIGEIYEQLRAPAWAARNLDALADVLRDLSWLPPGAVPVRTPAGLAPAEGARLHAVLRAAVAETADGPRPVDLDARGERA